MMEESHLRDGELLIPLGKPSPSRAAMSKDPKASAARLIGLREAAQLLDCSVMTVRRRIKEKVVPVYQRKPNAALKFKLSDLLAYRESLLRSRADAITVDHL